MIENWPKEFGMQHWGCVKMSNPTYTRWLMLYLVVMNEWPEPQQ